MTRTEMPDACATALRQLVATIDASRPQDAGRHIAETLRMALGDVAATVTFWPSEVRDLVHSLALWGPGERALVKKPWGCAGPGYPAYWEIHDGVPAAVRAAAQAALPRCAPPRPDYHGPVVRAGADGPDMAVGNPFGVEDADGNVLGGGSRVNMVAVRRAQAAGCTLKLNEGAWQTNLYCPSCDWPVWSVEQRRCGHCGSTATPEDRA